MSVKAPLPALKAGKGAFTAYRSGASVEGIGAKAAFGASNAPKATLGASGRPHRSKSVNGTFTDLKTLNVPFTDITFGERRSSRPG